MDILQSRRSTGSILKPFLYAAMLKEGGLTPVTLVPDTPVRFEGFRPENFDRRFRGAVPARTALAWSLNVPAVRELREYGIPRFENRLRQWGMTTLDRTPDDYGLTLVLGGAEGRPHRDRRALRQAGPARLGRAGRRAGGAASAGRAAKRRRA